MVSIGRGEGGPFFGFFRCYADCVFCECSCALGQPVLRAGGHLVVSVVRAMSRVRLARVYRPIQFFCDYIRVVLGLYWDNGKSNGNYYLGFRI